MNAAPRFFFGLQGVVGWLDGVLWTGEVGTFVGHTVSATRLGHPIFEVRWTTPYMIELQDVHVTVAFTVFPRMW